jgi:hypothetical protein
MSLDVYSSEWVDRLYRGLKRNLRVPFRMVCLVDCDDYVFKEPVVPVRFSRSDLGWMALNEVYRPDVVTEQNCFIALDTIILRDVTDMFSREHTLSMVKDPLQGKKLCNAIVFYSREEGARLWGLYSLDPDECARKYRIGSGYPSEYIWLQSVVGKPNEWLDDLYPGAILSYKAHVKRNNARVHTAQIIYFHGKPKQHQLREEWIKEHWR